MQVGPSLPGPKHQTGQEVTLGLCLVISLSLGKGIGHKFAKLKQLVSPAFCREQARISLKGCTTVYWGSWTDPYESAREGIGCSCTCIHVTSQCHVSKSQGWAPCPYLVRCTVALRASCCGENGDRMKRWDASCTCSQLSSQPFTKLSTFPQMTHEIS